MWHIGVHRYVCIIGPVVIKIPRVKLIQFFALILKDIRDLRWWVFKIIVLGGIIENINEATCYFHTRHKLLARLYLPLVFINVYRRESGVGNFTFGGDELTNKVYKTGDREYLKALLPCSHTFDRTENFSYDGVCLKILDYGEKGFEHLLLNYGEQIKKLLLSVANQPT
ncbi:MAG: hypothetical protein WC473_02135 [Patescibacteria group bacterium]